MEEKYMNLDKAFSQIKTTSSLRKNFDSWPKFHQAGLYYTEYFKKSRYMNFDIKYALFEAKKQDGNEEFKAGNLKVALQCYEEALTLWRWVEAANDNWANDGVKDAELTVVYAEQTAGVKECMVTCYLNIAICNLKLNKYNEAISACDEALNIDDKNVKALYRKALAITAPASSGIEDYKNAIDLLKTALKYEENNTAVKSKLKEFHAFVKQQTAKNKQTYASFFKTSLYDVVEPEAKEMRGPNIEEMIQNSKLMIKSLESGGNKRKARQLKHKIEKMERARSNLNYELEN